jgi:putative mRNA 3-end processing factor
LTDAAIPVLQHRDVFAVSQVYEACGMSLGQHERLTATPKTGWAVVVPPGVGTLERLGRQVRIAVTGWAVDPRVKYRFRVDHAIPLSDHADYDELFEAVARVDPRVVYCTHGPEEFVDRLRDAGYDAHPLGRPSQPRLF